MSTTAWRRSTAGARPPAPSCSARASCRCSLAVTGPAVSGPALMLGLADQVVLTKDAYAFVSGPHMVQAFTGVPVTNVGLGGAGTHARATGVASLLVEDAAEAWLAIEELVALLPANTDELPPVFPNDDPEDRQTPEAGALLPASPTGSYDVRDVIRCVVDDGELLDLRAGWAAKPRHRARHHRRPSDRHRGQPTQHRRRHARHPGLAERRTLRRLLRRVQHPARDLRRHARLLPRARTSNGGA